MNVATRKRLRERLAALREELIAAGNVDIPPARTDVVSQPDDDEAPLTEMTQTIASSRNRERTERLDAIDDALTRLDEDPDDFGLCEMCEEPIGSKRLELMPWVSLCVACQDKLERENRAPGGRKNLLDYH